MFSENVHRCVNVSECLVRTISWGQGSRKGECKTAPVVGHR